MLFLLDEAGKISHLCEIFFGNFLLSFLETRKKLGVIKLVGRNDLGKKTLKHPISLRDFSQLIFGNLKRNILYNDLIMPHKFG